MSRATTTLNALKAENLMAGSYVLTQIDSLRADLRYRTDGETVSYDDYYLKLQTEIDALPRLKLETSISTGTENQYIMQLVKGLEEIFDDADRVVRRIIHYQSRLRNAVSRIGKLRAAFNAWYTLAAGESLEENGAKFPSNQLKDLASSEFSRLMENLDVEVESLLEAVKVQVEQIKQWKKTQQDKFNLGKDQANASWTSGLPNFGEGDRSDQLLERNGFEIEMDNEVPAFVSEKPRITPYVEEVVTKYPSGHLTATELTGEIKGTFFKRSTPVAITPIINDDAPMIPISSMDIDKVAPIIPTIPGVAAAIEATKENLQSNRAAAEQLPVPASLTAVFANAKEVVPEVKAIPKPKKEKVEKTATTFVAPTSSEQVVTRTKEDGLGTIHCGDCHRRIQAGQTMFQRVNRPKEYFHAVVVDCLGKVPVARGHKDTPADPVPAVGEYSASSIDVLPPTRVETPAFVPDTIVTHTGPVAEGTLLELMEKATVPNTTSDNPPETEPLAAVIPNVDAPATSRKRLTFLEDDAEIM